MSSDPKPEDNADEPVSTVAAVETPDMSGDAAENIRERGEPFEGNVA